MQAILVLAMCTLGSGVRLLKRDLSGYQLAKCNDGTPAAYYHDQVGHVYPCVELLFVAILS